MTTVRAREVVVRAWSVRLYRNSLIILSTTAVTSAVGYVFWGLAARTSGPETTGLVGSMVSAVATTELLTTTGLVVGSIPLLAQTSDAGTRRGDAVAGAVMVGLLSLVGGLVLVTVVPHLVPSLARAADPVVAAGLVVLTVSTPLGLFTDTVALTSGRTGVTLVRGAVASTSRLLVFLVPGGESLAVLVWAFALATTLGDVVALALLRPAGVREHLRGAVPRFWARRRFYTGHHATSLGAAGAVNVLPVIVLSVLGPVAAGYFYPTWLLGGMFFPISSAVANSYMARVAPDAGSLRQPVRQAVLLIVLLLAAPLLVVAVASGPLLSLLGPGYVTEGRLLLWVLALAAIPDAVTNMAVATLRVQGRLQSAATLNAGMSVLAVVLAFPLLSAFGIAGGGIALLLAQTAGALAVPFLLRARGTLEG